MNKPIPILTAFLVAVGSLAAATGGCELIASVDRSLIPGSGGAGGATSSTTTTTTTSSTGGTGGTCAGGAMACASPTDCPAPPSDCVTDTCTASCCGTSNAAVGAACTSGGGTVCDGNGNCVACNGGGDCAPQATLCKVNTCMNNTCGTMNAAAEATCSDNGGKVCDGSGTCVACVAPSDCPATGTVCATPVCTANACDTSNAAKGAPCSDNGGTVCDGMGMCVAAHCNDTVKDADETDVDCGGASCGGCANTKGCMAPGDCLSGFCKTMACAACAVDGDCAAGKWCDLGNNGGTCTATQAQASLCSASDQCTSGHCVDGVCCDTACSGTCQACTMALTGSADGTCANETAGKQAPAGQCAANGTCGNTGNCAAGGVCQETASGVPCGAASCANGQLTPAGMCNGSGTCTPGSAMACPGGFVCAASGTACKTACGADGDCESASDYCQNPGASGTCVAKGVAGATCTANDQCTTALCGTAGTGTHCCANGTTCPATVPACGTTDCDNTGACAYPGNSVAPAGLQTSGDCQKLVCNGSGGDTPVDDLNDLPTSNTLCEINPSCQGSPAAPHFDPAMTGTDCTNDNNPPNHVCGDTSNNNIAGTCVECNVDVDCSGGDVCNSSTGSCVACVPAGGTIGDAGDCATDCCNMACSSGTICM